MSGHGDPRCPSRHPHLSTIASWRYWKVNGGATIGEIRFRSFTGARSSSSHLPRNRRSTRRANVASNDAQGCTVRGHALIRLVSAECSSDFDFRSQDIGGEVGRLAAGRVRGNAAHRAGKKVRAKDPLSTREGKPPRIQAMNEGTGKRRSALDGAGRSSELPAGSHRGWQTGKHPTFRRTSSRTRRQRGSAARKPKAGKAPSSAVPSSDGSLLPKEDAETLSWVYVSPSFAGIVVRHLLCRRRAGKVASIRRGPPRTRRIQARYPQQGC